MKEKSGGTCARTVTDAYSRESLSRLSRRDVEFGLELRLLLFDSHRARAAAYMANARAARVSHRFTPGAGPALALLWVQLADTAIDRAFAEARIVARIVDFLTGDEAGRGAEIEAALSADRQKHLTA